MHLCDLPDDILRLVLEATVFDRRRAVLTLNRATYLLAVCRRLRHVALPIAYSTVATQIGDWHEPMGVQPAGALSSLELAVLVGCGQCVRRLAINVRYGGTPIDGLKEAAKRLRVAAGKLAGVVTLRLYIDAKERTLGWDGVDAAVHEADIQAICGAIVAAVPGVRFMDLILKTPDSVAQEVSRRLVVHYSGQLQDLAIMSPIAVPRGTEFKRLRRLGLNYGHISTSRAPRISPAGLELLRLQGRLTTTAWASFATGVRDRELVFANLKVLSLKSLPPGAMPSFAAQPHARTTWRLHFPSLRHAYIHCSQGPFPVLGWVVFPPGMTSLSLNVAPAVLRVVDEVANIPAAQDFNLMFPHGFEDDPAVLSMVRRVLKKAHRCKARELVVFDNALPLLIDMVVSAPVTHLTLGMADMDVVTDLIRRTSSITTLRIIRLNTDDAQLEISVPPPGSGRAVEPLNTSITELCLGWYSLEQQPNGVSAAKYLLLAIPSLLRLNTPNALVQQLTEFASAHSACYPHLPNIAIRAWY